MITKINQTAWINDKRKELVRIEQPGQARVIPATCTPDELRELAEACVLAADAIDDAELETNGAFPRMEHA